MSTPRTALATACLSLASLAALLGGGAVAQAAGPPTAITSHNTPEAGGRARLLAYLNPQGAQITDCHFEYGLGEGYGSEAPCEQDPGEGEAPVEVTAHLTGLTPGATYHYRLLAANAFETIATADATFRAAEEPPGACPNPRALGAGFLSECRAWEMVSPPDKNGNDVLVQTSHFRAADDGSAASFNSPGPFGSAGGAGIASEYVSVRSPAGWSTHGILPPLPATTEAAVLNELAPRYLGEFSADFQRGLVVAWRPLDEQDPNVAAAANLYMRTDLRSPGAGSFRLLSGCPLCAETEIPLPATALSEHIPTPAGASADYSHVLFESPLDLVSGAKGGSTKLYEWVEGSLRLACILPDGKPASPCSAGIEHAISADGSKVFFSDPSSGNVYMRLNGEETVRLNASEGGAGPAAKAGLAAASADGSRVFFKSSQALTEDVPVGAGQQLYMYDTTLPDSDSHNLTWVSAPEPGAEAGKIRAVDLVPGGGADGSTVYFTVAGQLQAGALARKDGLEHALFAWHEGKVAFIAALNNSDEISVGFQSRVSPDGEIFFPVSLPTGPTGYVQNGITEYYTYNPHTEALQCASCDPSGAAPKSGSFLSLNLNLSLKPYRFGKRFLDDRGEHAFFTTAEPLVPADVNGRRDAYVFDTRTARVTLLSSGSDAADSYAMETGADGRDGFFITRERLSAWDVDTANDVYDARVDGGVPEPTPPPPSCQGDACQPAPLQLDDPTPASSSFHGAANRQRKKAHKKKHRRHVAKHKRAEHNRRAGR